MQPAGLSPKMTVLKQYIYGGLSWSHSLHNSHLRCLSVRSVSALWYVLENARGYNLHLTKISKMLVKTGERHYITQVWPGFGRGGVWPQLAAVLTQATDGDRLPVARLWRHAPMADSVSRQSPHNLVWYHNKAASSVSVKSHQSLKDDPRGTLGIITTDPTRQCSN